VAVVPIVTLLLVNPNIPLISSFVLGFVVPIPRLPVDGLNTSFVEETPTVVETPEVTSSNAIKRSAFVETSLIIVTPPLLDP
jgi:hypothetical protein